MCQNARGWYCLVIVYPFLPLHHFLLFHCSFTTPSLVLLPFFLVLYHLPNRYLDCLHARCCAKFWGYKDEILQSNAAFQYKHTQINVDMASKEKQNQCMMTLI